MNILPQLIKHQNKNVFIYDNNTYSYQWLIERIHYYYNELNYIGCGDVVQICSSYHPEAIALFIALVNRKAIISPLTNVPEGKVLEYTQITKPKLRFTIDSGNELIVTKLNLINDHEIIKPLIADNNAGLIIMSSGTTGASKAIVHNMQNIVDYQKLTKSHKTILSFLLFDHIGGINNMINSILSGNLLILTKNYDIDSTARLMVKHSVDTLITSPSFLNLMTIQNVWDNYSLHNLKHINYGSEVMPKYLLEILSSRLPNVKLSQAYGTSETGVIKTISENNQSLMIKVSDDNINFRVVNDRLEIKSNTTMLGYLNAPSPFTADGWFMTGDVVIQNGEWLQVLGRDSDIINVGGQKVFPIEVENVLMQLDGISDVIVFKEYNSILGNIVVANVVMNSVLNKQERLQFIREYCFKTLERYKVPQKIEFVEQIPYNLRNKKIRTNFSKES